MICGSAAERRRQHEGCDRRDKVNPPTDPRRQPSGHRQHHADRDQVTGHDPRNLVDFDAEAALHVGQRHVDDRNVQRLHERPEHHRGGNQPFVSRLPAFFDGDARREDCRSGIGAGNVAHTITNAVEALRVPRRNFCKPAVIFRAAKSLNGQADSVKFRQRRPRRRAQASFFCQDSK
jgi:hypothetical protein